MLFNKFVMLKMFLSATLSGMFCLSLMSMIPATRKKYLAAKRNFASCLKEKSYTTVMIGAALLGAGMSVAGTCPGLVLAQVGAGTTNAGFTFAGALLGAMIYGLFEPLITAKTRPQSPVKYQFLTDVLGSPYFTTALPLVSCLGLVIFALELQFPWRQEVEVAGLLMDKRNLLSLYSWPPYVCGAMIGLLQVPVVLLFDDTLGGSSSYCTIVSTMLYYRSVKKFSPYLYKFQSGMSNWWQVLYICGAIGGAALSSMMSGSFGITHGVSVVEALLGGFLIVFGARLAGGCTSGHGLSGMGLLNLLSVAGVVAMFAGGIFTAMNKLILVHLLKSLF